MEKRRTASASRTAGLVLVTVAWALFLATTGSPEAILFTLPVFLIAAPLAFGRYVGEGVIASLRSRPRARRTGDRSTPLSGLSTVLVDSLVVAIVPGRGPPATAR